MSSDEGDRLLVDPGENHEHQEPVSDQMNRSAKMLDNLRQDAVSICNDRCLVFETSQRLNWHTVAKITLSRDRQPQSNAAHMVTLTCELPSQGQDFLGRAGAQHH